VKIESLSIENFRCFGPKPTKIDFETGVTAFVGGNGSGKTAAFQALSRLCGVTEAQRTVRRQDFHLAVNRTAFHCLGQDWRDIRAPPRVE
jgi:predicted ATP-dependent endonuclease of OLD family